MDKHSLYRGKFISRHNTLWEVEIWGKTSIGKVGELRFPHDSPLVIEWGEVSKEEAICSSTATLRILSPDDRSYQHLYVIEAGSIGIDILRKGKLWWRGTLDPEFYEEPYERMKNYIVELTFSDFGILDRLKYEKNGVQAVGDILRDAIQKIGLSPMPIDNSLLSGRLSNGSEMLPDGLSVRSDNFIDEDGRGDNLKEVISSILQPLGARLLQRDGRIWLYDLHGLHQSPTSQKIIWRGARQTLGVDKVANAVNISFSPYGKGELMHQSISYLGEPIHASKVNLSIDKPSDGDYYSFKRGFPYERETFPFINTPHTTIHFSEKGRGVAKIGPECRYFSTFSHVGASREEGVAVVVRGGATFTYEVGKDHYLDVSEPERWLVGETTSIKQKTFVAQILDNPPPPNLILRSHRVWLPSIDSSTSSNSYLRLSVEMMIDFRYNPFSSDKGNLENVNEWVSKRSAFAFVPVTAIIYDAEGHPILYYDNRSSAYFANVGDLFFSDGAWKSVGNDQEVPTSQLEWYDLSDIRERSGICQGFRANRHCIGRPDGRYGRPPLRYSPLFKNMPDGEYMPYPPRGGWLEISIYKGIQVYDANPEDNTLDAGNRGGLSTWEKHNSHNSVRWWLFKAPKVDIVSKYPPHEVVELDDVEHRATLNPYAAESIDIDTKLGTLPQPFPSARGIFFRSSDGLPLQKISRGGRTASPEELLIGTIYSQFAQRRTTLTGEVKLSEGWTPFNEACQKGKRFIVTAENIDLRREEGEAKFVELRPDEYQPRENVNHD